MLKNILIIITYFLLLLNLIIKTDLIPNSSNFLSDSLNFNQQNNRRSISPLTNSQIIFLNTISNVQQPGVDSNRNTYNLPGNQTPRITAQNLHKLDWTQIDRRSEEGKKKMFIFFFKTILTFFYFF